MLWIDHGVQPSTLYMLALHWLMLCALCLDIVNVHWRKNSNRFLMIFTFGGTNAQFYSLKKLTFPRHFETPAKFKFNICCMEMCWIYTCALLFHVLTPYHWWLVISAYVLYGLILVTFLWKVKGELYAYTSAHIQTYPVAPVEIHTLLTSKGEKSSHIDIHVYVLYHQNEPPKWNSSFFDIYLWYFPVSIPWISPTSTHRNLIAPSSLLAFVVICLVIISELVNGFHCLTDCCGFGE